MSLAGVQEKLPVFVDEDGVISIPVDGTPSTHSEAGHETACR